MPRPNRWTRGALVAGIAFTGLEGAPAGGNRPTRLMQLPAPTLEQPVWNSTTPGLDAAHPTNLRVKIRKVADAAKYQIVVEDLSGVVFVNRILRPTDGMQDPQTVLYNIAIPPGKEGTVNRVRVRSCYANDQCSPASRQEQFIVLPSPPAVTEPASGATVPASRSVTFRWFADRFGRADYQVSILTEAPEAVGWNGFHPDVVPPPSASIRVRARESSLTHTLTTARNAFIWGVAWCLVFPEKGRRCGPTTAFRSLTVATGPTVSFAAVLAPTFQHARCLNCHAVAASGLTTVVPTPAHQGVAIGNTANCSGCHTTSLMPSQGFNPGWHEAPASMDFRGKTPAQLCAMARNPASAGSVLNHLTQDRLILWAVGDGRVPNGSTRPVAPPSSIATWQSQVQQWVDAGMPCG